MNTKNLSYRLPQVDKNEVFAWFIDFNGLFMKTKIVWN